MRLPDFLREPAAAAALRRAGRAAATPLSLHVHGPDGEGLRVWGQGACRACERAVALEEGAAACRESRSPAGAAALRRGAPVPFVCHLGFACVCAPGPRGTGAALTFGPYCPADAAYSLEADVRHGLRVLGVEPGGEELAALARVPIRPAESVWAVAEWTSELLEQLWGVRHAEAPCVGEEEAEAADAPVRLCRPRPASDTRETGLIAAALAAGDQQGAREITRQALAGCVQGRGGPGRLFAFVAEALAACEEARLEVSGAFEAFAALAKDLPREAAADVGTEAAMGVLGVVRRRTAAQGGGDATLAAVKAYLTQRLHERPTLREAAERVGLKPNTLTRQLERRYGFTFTQYLGKLRVEEAKRLLAGTKLTVPEVAARVGVRDPSNFAKLFRRYAGCAPSSYRRRLKDRP